MRTLLAALMLMSLTAAAQQMTPAEMDGRIAALEQQRNEQANAVVVAAGRLNAALAEIERLKKAATECEPKQK